MPALWRDAMSSWVVNRNKVRRMPLRASTSAMLYLAKAFKNIGVCWAGRSQISTGALPECFQTIRNAASSLTGVSLILAGWRFGKGPVNVVAVDRHPGDLCKIKLRADAVAEQSRFTQA